MATAGWNSSISVRSLLSTFRWRKRMIRKLERELSTRLAALRPPSLDRPLDESDLRAHATLISLQSEIKHLKQAPLIEYAERFGFEIPTGHWYTPSPNGLQRTLKPEGERALQLQIRRHRKEAAEYWVKLVTPILALLVSMFSLAVA